MKFKALLKKIRDWLSKFLKDKVVKTALIHLLGTTAGWKAWILKFIVTELFEEVVEPMIKALFREIGHGVDKAEGKRKFQKIQEAMREEDPSKYDSAVDDVFK